MSSGIKQIWLLLHEQSPLALYKASQEDLAHTLYIHFLQQVE